MGANQLGSGLFPFFLHYKQPKLSLRQKCALFTLVTVISSLAMCGVDYVGEPWSIFTILGLGRLAQGIGMGGLFILVQVKSVNSK